MYSSMVLSGDRSFFMGSPGLDRARQGTWRDAKLERFTPGVRQVEVHVFQVKHAVSGSTSLKRKRRAIPPSLALQACCKLLPRRHLSFHGRPTQRFSTRLAPNEEPIPSLAFGLV